MTKRLMWLAVGLCLLLVPGLAMANESNDFGVEWDAEAVASMSKEERLAYQRQYKEAVEAAARAAGYVPGQRTGAATGRTAPVPDVPGTSITYHSGTLSAATTSSFCVGNQFDTALTTMGGIGPVEMSGSVTMVTLDMVAVGGGQAFISFYDQLAGTTANQITSFVTPMVAGGNTITFATPINYVGSSFLGGVWNFTAGTDTVNVATGTVGGQGFHGMSINDGNPGIGFNALTMTNGAFAVGGNVATPVELMSFEID